MNLKLKWMHFGSGIKCMKGRELDRWINLTTVPYGFSHQLYTTCASQYKVLNVKFFKAINKFDNSSCFPLRFTGIRKETTTCIISFFFPETEWNIFCSWDNGRPCWKFTKKRKKKKNNEIKQPFFRLSVSNICRCYGNVWWISSPTIKLKCHMT